MKKLNVKASICLALLSLSVTTIDAFASEKLLKTKTIKSFKAIDPYYDLKKITVRELTPEEELEFIGDLPGLDSINTTISIDDQLKINKIPKIPPRPPEIKDPMADSGSSSEVNKGATDIVAAGGGGSSSGSGSSSGNGGGVGSILDSIIMVSDKVAAIGDKILPLIERGRPVVTNKPMSAISVIPRLETKDPVLHDMEGWSIPMSKHYKIAYSNGYGGEVVSFVYSISYQYGGQYLGLGKYLTGIRASARNIVVNWGFDLDASSQLIQISNVGTSKNVVAGATVEISYTVKNWSRSNTSNEAFFISGDGKLYKMD